MYHISEDLPFIDYKRLDTDCVVNDKNEKIYIIYKIDLNLFFYKYL